MKGTLMKTEQGWMVSYLSEYKQSHSSVNEWRYIPLHPEFIEMMDTCFTSKFTREVEFEFVTEWENGEVGVNGLTYAKLIHHSVDTDKMIDHIGEVNEMVNHVPDAGKMVEDDYIEELTKGEIGWYDKHDDDQVKAFIAGYNKAKESLYTEEQVLKIVLLWDNHTITNEEDRGHIKSIEKFIQSLKKHKQ